MKRRLLIIAICLLLGAVVNVAVAWGIDSWIEEQTISALRHRVSTPGLVEPTQEYLDSFHLRPIPRLYAVGFPADAMGYDWPHAVFQQDFRLRPLWPGFAVNTVFYAAISWLFIHGSLVLRRYWRVEQGFCPTCVYPMGESAVCTECGGALPKRARTA